MSKTTKEMTEVLAAQAVAYSELMDQADSFRTALAFQIKELAERAVDMNLEVVTLRATASNQAEIITQLQAALANTGNPSTVSPVDAPPFPGGQRGDFWEVFPS